VDVIVSEVKERAEDVEVKKAAAERARVLNVVFIGKDVVVVKWLWRRKVGDVGLSTQGRSECVEGESLRKKDRVQSNEWDLADGCCKRGVNSSERDWSIIAGETSVVWWKASVMMLTTAKLLLLLQCGGGKLEYLFQSHSAVLQQKQFRLWTNVCLARGLA
jgi:hypothetical protein